MSWASSNVPNLNAHDQRFAELRVYPMDRETGYFFVTFKAPARWYWKDEPGAKFFNRAEAVDLMADIAAGARVQLIGDHGRSLGLWGSWAEFEAAVK